MDLLLARSTTVVTADVAASRVQSKKRTAPLVKQVAIFTTHDWEW